MPLGSLLGGLLARIDLTTPLLVAGGLTAALAAGGYRFLHGLPDPEDVVEHEVSTPENVRVRIGKPHLTVVGFLTRRHDDVSPHLALRRPPDGGADVVHVTRRPQEPP
ncbi:hypothetical protein NKG05_15635 [Oerskovia sp. M15]